MAAAGQHRLVLASSMVVYGEGRYACAEHGLQAPPPRSVAALEAGDFENHCATCGAVLGWRTVPEDAATGPALLLRRHQARPGALRGRLGAARPEAPSRRCATTTSTAPDAAGHAVLRGGRDVPLLDRGRRPPTVFEDGRQARDFVHVVDVARCNLAAIDAVAARDWSADPGLRAYNVCSGRPITIQEVAELVVAGTGADAAPEVTGQFRPGDVRHVVASPERAAAELGFRAEVGPGRGAQRRSPRRRCGPEPGPRCGPHQLV